MNFENITTIDFETKAINGALPPQPVGVSIKNGYQPSKYYAWGHPTGNTSTFAEARDRLVTAHKGQCLYHNAGFDVAVSLQHMGLKPPKELHDTLLLLYLRDPHATTLSLKPSADALLGMAPLEKDLLTEWIVQNLGVKANKAGAYISEAPVELVDPYACGDTDRTFELFKALYPSYSGTAYDRECRLTPILVNNTLEGIRLDIDKLDFDYKVFTKQHERVTAAIYKHLNAAVFNVDSSEELADAIEKSGLAVEWVYTAKSGKRSTSKPNLLKAIKDEELLMLLAYRATLSTYLETFFSAWLSKQSNGRIHFSWNQVRNQEQESGKFLGTRTGRLSSSPSMLNVPKTPPSYPDEFLAKFDLRPLPSMRRYLLPDEGTTWLNRDYNSQELRLLAHYEDGDLMRAYNSNPRLDMHQLMSERLTKALGKNVTRRAAKTIAFSILYGSGNASLAEGLDCTLSEASLVKTAYLQSLPGIATVQKSIAYTWKVGDKIKTWGDRYYAKEQSRLIKDKRTGKERYADFGYKGLNYLIQGSAADVTKQAIINYDSIKQNGRFMLTVHDQIDCCGPISEMKLLEEAMSDIKVDVPMVSDAKTGDNFGELHDYTK